MGAGCPRNAAGRDAGSSGTPGRRGRGACVGRGTCMGNAMHGRNQSAAAGAINAFSHRHTACLFTPRCCSLRPRGSWCTLPDRAARGIWSGCWRHGHLRSAHRQPTWRIWRAQHRSTRPEARARATGVHPPAWEMALQRKARSSRHSPQGTQRSRCWVKAWAPAAPAPAAAAALTLWTCAGGPTTIRC